MNDTCSFSGYQKILGYKDGLQACGLEERPEYILQIPEAEDELSLAYHFMLDFIDTGLTFDALITADDVLAVGAQKALLSREIQIPIIGFNNTRLAQCTSPELTSVDTNMETICATATQILMDVLRGCCPASKVVISTRFVERGSFHR